MLETICFVLTMTVENNIQKDVCVCEREREREREIFNGLVDAHDTVPIFCPYG